jgi:thioredoxin 1
VRSHPLTAASFPDAVAAEGIVLVGFGAAWSPSCRAFTAVLDEAAGRHPDVRFGRVDTEAQPELAVAAGVRAVPTLMAFRDGVVVFAEPGALPGDSVDLLISVLRELDMAQVRAELATRYSDPDGT